MADTLTLDYIASFQQRLLEWFAVSGRHDLPWQVPDDPWKVWVSEIMLQQTQVSTVIPYFERFLQRFPEVQALAEASWEEVAPYWAGLGYYARARNLHRAAQLVHGLGTFPQDLEGWMALPGIGRSTAGAILSLGQGRYGVIQDGNVRRVLARHRAITGDALSPSTQHCLWSLATQLTPEPSIQGSHPVADTTDIRSAFSPTSNYNQAMMDLGATLCTRTKPACLLCPLNTDCLAFTQNAVERFPEKQPKAQKPIYPATVWLIHAEDAGALSQQQTRHEQKLWWLQRPEQGLWNGLWCLPLSVAQDLPIHERLHTFDAGTLPVTSASVETSPSPFRHVFSHFTLILSPRWISLPDTKQPGLHSNSNPNPNPTYSQPATGRWMTGTEALQAGIPAAMQKLLQMQGYLP